MVFQLRPAAARELQYPNAQDAEFLGFDRPNDRWKVDASGIKLYASGISVELEKDTDSVSVWSASGTEEIPVYAVDPLPVLDYSQIVPKIYDYVALTYVSGGNGDGEVETVTYKSGGSGGATQAILTLGYDGSDRVSTITRI